MKIGSVGRMKKGWENKIVENIKRVVKIKSVGRMKKVGKIKLLRK